MREYSRWLKNGTIRNSAEPKTAKQQPTGQQGSSPTASKASRTIGQQQGQQPGGLGSQPSMSGQSAADRRQ